MTANNKKEDIPMKNCPLKNELLSSVKYTGGRGIGTYSEAETSAKDRKKSVVRCSSGAVCCAFLALKLLTESDDELKEKLRQILK